MQSRPLPVCRFVLVGTKFAASEKNRLLFRESANVDWTRQGYMTSIRTSEFEQLYELLRSGQHSLKCLSLDCFDTILWRNVDQPVDVFYRLQHMPGFSKVQMSASLRQKSESDARKISSIASGSHEVDLEDIFRAAYPDADREDLDQLVQDEVGGEQEACFAYPPMLDLMRVAKEVGLDVIVVSDTYFSEPQLRALLSHNLPDDVFEAIDHFFCSNEHGRSKAGGLFNTVLRRLQLKPAEVLHIGDNEVADLEAPLAVGLSAFHFEHSGSAAAQILQMNSNATGLLAPEVRASEAMPSPFHPVFASSSEDESDPNVVMGYFAAGPLLYAFARLLRAHAEQAIAEGSKVKYLFLMRDGYLPQLAFEQLCPQYANRSYAVEVSRFAAYACSFRTPDDVDRYIARMGSNHIEAMAKQLLLSEADTRAMVTKARKTENPLAFFTAQVKKPGALKKIFRASQAFRERFYRYLENTMGLEAGDRLVFVDLGYTGTAQMCLEPVLEAERDVTVEGIYVLLANTPGWRRGRQGLIDPDLVSDSAVMTLVPYVAALEMICTNNEGSVVGYSEDGEAVRKEPDTSPEQHERVRLVQDACLRFLREAAEFYATAGEIFNMREMRLAALGALGRMTFFPTGPEVECMRGFHLDVNLATDITVALFDTDRALDGLRKLGLFHALTEQRMNIPTELRYHGLELSLSLLVQHRFHQRYSLEDFSIKREAVNVMVAKGADSSVSEAMAFPGHDGYFSLIIPVGAYEYDVGIQFGMSYEWLQLGSVVAMAIQDIFAKKDFNKHQHESEIDISGYLHFDQMERAEGGILHCRNRNAFVMVEKPKKRPPSNSMIYLINFRPLVACAESGVTDDAVDS